MSQVLVVFLSVNCIVEQTSDKRYCVVMPFSFISWFAVVFIVVSNIVEQRLDQTYLFVMSLLIMF